MASIRKQLRGFAGQAASCCRAAEPAPEAVSIGRDFRSTRITGCIAHEVGASAAALRSVPAYFYRSFVRGNTQQEVKA
jgi:hypothetical protein